MSFAQKLKDLRKNRGLSQKALAEQIGKTARIISYYENEENGQALPKMEFVQLVADFFDVPINYFDETVKSKTKQDVIIEKLIDLSTDEKIKWSLLDNESLESSSEISFICEEIKNRYKIDLQEGILKAYIFDSVFDEGKNYYIIAQDPIFGYSLYIYKIVWNGPYEIRIENSEWLSSDLLVRLFKIIESTIDLKNLEFLDNVLKDLENNDVPF
ncbi:helix-turn-helix domain-containing protein [Peptostreptococcus russellii]|uniref:helix-turn-helix domain-containing protein n=1 Tax=Peptostreptococcus russellii TaxID=215200 RepID=UPI0026E92A3D|nr:helix-turn-helix transcriptional regulator [Peptostreptococcus russellii]